MKSIGTKCDLEEELKSSKQVELPFTNLRACEKTSDKLPWLIDLTGFQVTNNNLLIAGCDVNSVFSLKPMYQQYNNLLSSLSMVFSVDVSKRVEVNVRGEELETLIGWVGLIEKTARGFRQRIDYEEFEARVSYGPDGSEAERSGVEEDWDEARSYSTIRLVGFFCLFHLFRSVVIFKNLSLS